MATVARRSIGPSPARLTITCVCSDPRAVARRAPGRRTVVGGPVLAWPPLRGGSRRRAIRPRPVLRRTVRPGSVSGWSAVPRAIGARTISLRPVRPSVGAGTVGTGTVIGRARGRRSALRRPVRGEAARGRTTGPRARPGRPAAACARGSTAGPSGSAGPRAITTRSFVLSSTGGTARASPVERRTSVAGAVTRWPERARPVGGSAPATGGTGSGPRKAPGRSTTVTGAVGRAVACRSRIGPVRCPVVSRHASILLCATRSDASSTASGHQRTEGRPPEGGRPSAKDVRR